jgi:methylmalonyl-CoA mutase
VIGVNTYRLADDDPLEVLKVDNATSIASRSPSWSDCAPSATTTTYEPRSGTDQRCRRAIAMTNGPVWMQNLLALAVDAARAKATVGEISEALEKVYGRHQAEIRTISGVYTQEARSTVAPTRSSRCSTPPTFAEDEGRRPRILVAKMGQDGHDRGQKVIVTAFADLGFDVDVGPLFSTPEEVAQQAVDNDVHIVGVSSLAAGHLTLLPALKQRAGRSGPRRHHDRDRWRDPARRRRDAASMGAAAVFLPGTVIADSAVGTAREAARRRVPDGAPGRRRRPGRGQSGSRGAGCDRARDHSGRVHASPAPPTRPPNLLTDLAGTRTGDPGGDHGVCRASASRPSSRLSARC